ncbi:MAG: TIGR01620 family protein, partial [Pseudomonadota bacterium]
MKRPVVIEADDLPPAQDTVAEAPPVPEPDLPPAAMQRATQTVAARRGPFGRLVLWALGGLVSLGVSLTVWDFITGLFARNWILGQVALGLSVIVALGLVVWVLREVAAIARLGRIDTLQTRATDPQMLRDRTAAVKLTDDLMTLYATREDLRLASQTLRDRRDDILDADALLAEAETTLLAPLDAQARREVEAAT